MHELHKTRTSNLQKLEIESIIQFVLKLRRNYLLIFIDKLKTTASRPVCLGIKHSFGAYDQIFITAWYLWVCWYGAFSLTRGRVCLVYMLLALASVVFLVSESLWTRGRTLLSQILDFPFRGLLRLAGLSGGIRPRLHTGVLLDCNRTVSQERPWQTP
jgi:hypothetical protein